MVPIFLHQKCTEFSFQIARTFLLQKTLRRSLSRDVSRLKRLTRGAVLSKTTEKAKDFLLELIVPAFCE